MGYVIRQVFTTHVGLAFAICLLIIAILDLSVLLLIRPAQSGAVPSGWRPVISVFHAISFYLFCIGYIFSRHGGTSEHRRLAAFSFVLNVTGFFLHCYSGVKYRDYRPNW